MFSKSMIDLTDQVFPWQEHVFSPLEEKGVSPDLMGILYGCMLCGCTRWEGNHVAARVEPSPEDLAEWLSLLDKEISV